MAKRKSAKSSATNLNSLDLFKRALILIGKPIYALFLVAFLGLIFTSGSIIKLFELIRENVSKIFAKVPKGVALPKFPKISLPKISISLPVPKKVTFPKISVAKTLLIFISGFILSLMWFLVVKDIPSPDELKTRNIEVSTKIYDRNGILLYKIYKNHNRTLVNLAKVPLQMRLATLAAEDAEFYNHKGISVKGIVRSVIRNITRKELTGGSTITQQLVKNALLTPEKTISRKIKEVLLTIQVELTFSKDEILEMYFNEVAYGGPTSGIQEASIYYFGKSIEDVSLAEAAYLAGLPKSPTKYSPFGVTPEAGIARQKEVLNLMRINGYITRETQDDAQDQKLVFAPNKTDIKAPHFVMYVKDELSKKYGEELLYKGGLEVITTLDYSIQKLAEEAVKNEVAGLSRLRVGNGAAVVLNPKTGEILAMVGSRDYFDTKNDGNVNVTIRPRQPGSSIKVVNYAYALSNGYTPASIIDDSSITYNVPGQPPYSPKNYDGKFKGRITLRTALAESRNIPAVKVLASYGVSKMVEMGRRFGITTWDNPERFGLSLTLGGGETTLLELARVYATVANYGIKPEISSILKVSDYKGKVLEESSCRGESNLTSCNFEKVLDDRVAFLLIDILKDNIARAGEFGLHSSLVIPNHPEVSVKTGTSNDLRDNLTVGFNQKYLAAVWVGNNDNSPMSRIASGITGAAPIWNKIMSALLFKETSLDWEVPGGIAKITICPMTGTLPCQLCGGKLEYFLEEKIPTRACLDQTITEIKEKLETEKREDILESGAQTFSF